MATKIKGFPRASLIRFLRPHLAKGDVTLVTVEPAVRDVRGWSPPYTLGGLADDIRKRVSQAMMDGETSTWEVVIYEKSMPHCVASYPMTLVSALTEDEQGDGLPERPVPSTYERELEAKLQQAPQEAAELREQLQNAGSGRDSLDGRLVALLAKEQELREMQIRDDNADRAEKRSAIAQLESLAVGLLPVLLEHYLPATPKADGGCKGGNCHKAKKPNPLRVVEPIKPPTEDETESD